MIYHRKEHTKSQLAFWKRFKISELGLRIVLALIIVVGGLGYIILTTSVSTKGLAVKDLSDRLQSLNQERAVLQAKVDHLQSIQRLDAITKSLELVRVAGVTYLPPSTGAVASR